MAPLILLLVHLKATACSHIRRITDAIERAITERLGVNDSDEIRQKVLQQLASSTTIHYIHYKLVTTSTHYKLEHGVLRVR